MFDPEFYPTSKEVLNQMQLNVAGLKVLDPSCGSGNILEWCKENGATHTYGVEKNEQLATIANKKHSLIGDDWFKISADKISHVNQIVMNPPFSNGDKHLLHAIDIAPDGCEITCILNSETINNAYSRDRRLLLDRIKTFGFHKELGQVFSNAERKTDVNITLVKIFKPAKESDNEFEGFFEEEDEEQQQIGIMTYDFVRDIVNRYVQSVKMYDGVMAEADKINSLTSIFKYNPIRFGAYRNDGRYNSVNREEFKKELQKSAWHTVLGKMNIERLVTSEVMKKINKFVEEQEKYPFTMRNIYQMAEIIFKTADSNMNESLLNIFERITSHYHENRYSLEGWKTNSHYLVGKKFILPYLLSTDRYDMDYPRMNIHYTRGNLIDDFTKSLCYITGKNYSEIGLIYRLFNGIPKPIEFYQEDEKVLNQIESCWKVDYATGRIKVDKEKYFELKQKHMFESQVVVDRLEWGKWYDWGFFELKCFKKGTIHFKFKDEKVWLLFNQKVAKLKGYPLPEKL